MGKKRLTNTLIKPGINYREKRGLAKSTHLLAIVVASIAAALAFGLPVDPVTLTTSDNEETGKTFIQVTLPLPELQLEESELKAETQPLKQAVTASDVATVPAPPATTASEPALVPAPPATIANALHKPSILAYLHSIHITYPDQDLAEEATGKDTSAEAAAETWRTTTVKPGDNLTEIFVRLGLEPEKLYSLMSVCDKAEDLEKVQPGQVFKIRTDETGGLQELVLEIDKIHGTRVFRDGDAFKAVDYQHDIEKRSASAYGVVNGSLYAAATRAGMSDKIIVQLADIFSWDIDFSHDVHPGDAFTVVYEEDFFSGEKIGDGDILAVEYINEGKAYRAIGFRNAQGQMYYYTPEGQGLKRMFMRNPVDFSRISSPFQIARWHPILGKKRPHRGVDYAAAPGTPVKASGNGTVIHVGSKGGYGKTIIIDHGRGYTTLYAHLSKFKSGLRSGGTVEQGQVIGYVGQSGLATGPHLHYEFRVNGVHKNPVTVKLPGAEPILKKHRQRFVQHARNLISQLDSHQQNRLALYQR